MKRFLLALCLLGSIQSFAQLTVQGGFTAQQLAENLAGPGLTVTNATLIGSVTSRGTFQSVNTGLGVNSGVILTTGRIVEAVGPAVNDASNDNGRPGDAALNNLAGIQTYDAAVLQFDFVVETDNIQFNFVFASEEYPEFVGAGYNDVFAFFISGPGITGNQNIALVPGTTTPVSIDNINTGSYWQYYVDNASNTQVRFDAFTTRLTARKTGLIPCETYTLSLRIADAGDGVLDSGVFLEENSLVQGTVSATTNTASGDSIALEGCVKASFTFNLDTVYPQATPIPITVGGTATNGVDYAYIDSLIVIPAGQQSATVFVDAFADGLTEGQELVTLTYFPEPCAPPQVVRLYIQDNTPITFSSQGTNPTCSNANNGQIQLNISGGTAPYTVVLNGVDTFSTSTITNLPAGTYGIEVLDIYGCGAQAQVVGGQFPGSPVFIPDGTNVPYTTTIPITGFPPGTTLTSLNMLQNVCIDMEHSFLGQLEIRLYAPNGQFVVLKEHPGGSVTNLGEPVANGPVDTNNPDTMMGNCYTYCFNGNPTFGTMVSEANNYTYTYTDNRGMVLSDKYLPSGAYTPFQNFNGLIGTPLNGNWTIWVRDNNPQNNGWVCTWSISLVSDFSGDTIVLSAPASPALSATTTSASCGSSNGAINLSLAGGTGPFTYAWSNGANTQDLSGIPAGTYTVTVTGAANCQTIGSFSVSNVSAPTVAGVSSLVSCPGGNNGGVNITPTGTGPFTYAWSNGNTTQDLVNVPAGSYTVTVTGSGGCQSITAYVVASIPGMVATPSLQNETCGEENGSIAAGISGGTVPYTYAWSTGASGPSIQQLSAGNYSLTVTDANQCTLVRSFNLLNVVGNCFIPCDLSLNLTAVTPETCGSGLGAIDLSASSSFLPLTYQWSTGAVTQDLSWLSAGLYFVTISDANHCTLRDSFLVANNTGSLTVNGIVPVSEFCGNGQGSIDLSLSGGVLPYRYAWSNGATTQDIFNLNQGTYVVTITDANGCSLIAQSTVVNNTGSMVQTYGNAVPETCGNGQGSIDITVTSPAGFLSYAWSNGATTEDLFPISTGSYTCTVTDQNGCQLVTPTYLVGNNSGSLAIVDIDLYDETCGNSTGAINLDIAGGAAPLSYTWSNGATTQDINGLGAGTYSATVTDNNGCSVSTGPQTINDLPGNLVATVVHVQNEICGNGLGSINLAVSGSINPVTYLWSTGSTSQDLVNRTAGNYQVTVTDANGCVQITGATIQNDGGTLEILNAVVTADSCSRQTGRVDLFIGNPTNPVTYAWNNGSNTQDLAGISAGSYQVTVSDANGCPEIASFVVPAFNNSLSLGQVSVTNASCGLSNGAVDIDLNNSSGTISYTWSNGITVQDLQQAAPGSYQVTITDANQCPLVAGPFVVGTSSGSLFASIQAATNPTCASSNGSIDLSVTGQAPITYLWNDNFTTQDRNNLPAGNYTVNITDGLGCSTVLNIPLTANSGNLTANVAQITDAVCGGSQGGVLLNVSGGSNYSYLWSNGSTGASLSGVVAGNYSVTISSGGCQTTLTGIQVSNSPGTLSITSLTHTDAICGSSTGSIDLSVAGGNPPVTYIWSNGATTQDIGNLPAGVYRCTISSSGGCSITAGAVIQNASGNLTLLSANTQPSTCGNANGSITLNVAGANPPVTYTWSNGGNGPVLNNLSAGSYTCLIQDNSGCLLNPTIIVPDAGGLPSISVNSIVSAQCLASDGGVDIGVAGGTSPYIFGWSNGSSTQDLSNVSAGSFSVTVTDNNGCTVNSTIQIPQGSGQLGGTSAILTQASCGNPNGAIDLAVSGNTGPYIFGWSNGSTSEDISNLLAGNYSVNISDQNGCTFQNTYTISNSGNGFSITGGLVSNENCGASNGGIDLSVSAGSGNLTYVWSNGATTQDLSNLGQGSYSVTVTDQAGCDVFGGPFNVQNVTGNLTASFQSNYETCGDSAGTIDLSVVGGTAPYSYSWSNGATTQDLQNLPAGSYSVTVIDGANCAFVQQITILNTQGSLAISGAVTTPASCGASNGGVDISVTGGTLPYQYAWSNGALTQDLTNVGSGTYTLTLTDAVGCESITSHVVANNNNGFALTFLFFGDENCGQSDGYIQAQATGGVSPITYTLSNGSSDPSGIFFGLPAGTYTVSAIDGQGCTISQTVVIQNFGSLTLGPNFVTDASCAACSDGAIDLNVSPPGNYNYFWSTGANTQDISSLPPGVYSVNVDDGVNCFLYQEFIVSYPNATDVGAEWNLSVHPNPNDGRFRLDYELDGDEAAHVEVLNLMGQIIWSGQTPPTRSGSVLIELPDSPAGSYLLRISNDKATASRLVIVF